MIETNIRPPNWRAYFLLLEGPLGPAIKSCMSPNERVVMMGGVCGPDIRYLHIAGAVTAKALWPAGFTLQRTATGWHVLDGLNPLCGAPSRTEALIAALREIESRGRSTSFREPLVGPDCLQFA